MNLPLQKGDACTEVAFSARNQALRNHLILETAHVVRQFAAFVLLWTCGVH